MLLRSLEITEIFFTHFGQKFREINDFTKEVTIQIVDLTNFFNVIFSFFHTAR